MCISCTNVVLSNAQVIAEDTGESDGEGKIDKSKFAGAQIPATPEVAAVLLTNYQSHTRPQYPKPH